MWKTWIMVTRLRNEQRCSMIGPLIYTTRAEIEYFSITERRKVTPPPASRSNEIPAT